MLTFNELKKEVEDIGSKLLENYNTNKLVITVNGAEKLYSRAEKVYLDLTYYCVTTNDIDEAEKYFLILARDRYVLLRELVMTIKKNYNLN